MMIPSIGQGQLPRFWKKLNFCWGCSSTFHFWKIFLELGTSFGALIGALHQIPIHFNFKLVHA